MSKSIIVVSPKKSRLTKLDRARKMLAQSRTLPEVKNIRNIAEAARIYAKAAHLGRESQNFAAEIALLAACKAGAILKQLDKSKGGERTHRTAANIAGVSEYAKTLRETKTPERTAQYWQKLAEVPEKTRTAYIASIKQAEVGEITAAGLLRAGRPQSVQANPEASPLDVAYDTFSPFFTESPESARNILPTVVEWLKLRKVPLTAQEIQTLSALITFVREISTLTSQWHDELRQILDTARKKVAA